MDACNLNQLANVSKLKVVEKKDRCRYHNIGQIYSSKAMSPSGLCHSAYQRLYPLCLARLYKKGCDNNKESIETSCLGREAKIYFEIKKRPFKNLVKHLEIFLRRMLKKFFFLNLECIDGDIIIKVVRIEGRCPAGHKVGDIFRFNIDKKDELCPAAFYNIFPLCAGLEQMNSAKKSICFNVFSCPDHKTNIAFEIIDDTVKKKSVSDDVHPACSILDNIFISIKSNKNQVEDIRFNSLIRHDICPLLAYVCYPYFVTLKDGGDFGWLEKYTVIAQCPHPQARVSVKLKRGNDHKIKCEVVRSNDCPKMIRSRKSFYFDEIISDKIPHDLLFSIFPFLFAMHYSQSDMKEPIRLLYKQTNTYNIEVAINKGIYI